MSRIRSSALLIVTLAVAVPLADVWDVQSDNDNSSLTDNELVHGTTQQHDLGALAGPTADQDWYLMPQPPQSSWEIVVDGLSGDLGGAGGVAIQRIASDTTTVLQASVPAVTDTFGYSRALRWANTTSVAVPEAYVRVSGALCGTGCGSDDVYTIRARETTINVARWNQSGSQVTVLLTQNTTNRLINATFFYYSSAGALLHSGTLAGFGAKQLNVFNLGTVPALAGQSGHLVIAHDSGYGGLNVKAIALEPATGFSFDTPGVYKPY